MSDIGLTILLKFPSKILKKPSNPYQILKCPLLTKEREGVHIFSFSNFSSFYNFLIFPPNKIDVFIFYKGRQQQKDQNTFSSFLKGKMTKRKKCQK